MSTSLESLQHPVSRDITSRTLLPACLSSYYQIHFAKTPSFQSTLMIFSVMFEAMAKKEPKSHPLRGKIDGGIETAFQRSVESNPFSRE